MCVCLSSKLFSIQKAFAYKSSPIENKGGKERYREKAKRQRERERDKERENVGRELDIGLCVHFIQSQNWKFFSIEFRGNKKYF